MVGAEHIVEIQVGMSESHRGNGLVMAAEDHETRLRETLAQFPDMLPATATLSPARSSGELRFSPSA